MNYPKNFVTPVVILSTQRKVARRKEEIVQEVDQKALKATQISQSFKNTYSSYVQTF